MKIKKAVAVFLTALLVAGPFLVPDSALIPEVSSLEPHGNGIVFRDGWAHNDPEYTFSDEYKTSIWYQNFAGLTLSENQRNNVLRIAISQLGYHEGSSMADCNGMNTASDGNVTEYARLIKLSTGKPYGTDGVDYAFNWCACFVDWCLCQAHIDNAYAEISCGRWIDDWFAKPEQTFYVAKAFGGSYVPRPADLIFFDWEGKNSWPDHIGLVLYADETTVYTIEGNTKDNDVGIRAYPYDSPLIRGYGVPSYDEGDEQTLNFSQADGVVAGEYVVKSTNATLRSNDGTAIPLPLGDTLRVNQSTSGTVITAVYNGISGTVDATSILLLTPDVFPTKDDTSPPVSDIESTEETSNTTAESETVKESASQTTAGSTTPFEPETPSGVESTVDDPNDIVDKEATAPASDESSSETDDEASKRDVFGCVGYIQIVGLPSAGAMAMAAGLIIMRKRRKT